MTATLILTVGTLGPFGPSHPYSEEVWLPKLGPAAFALWRRLARELDRHPTGVTVTATDLSDAIGVSSLRVTSQLLERLEHHQITTNLASDGATVEVRVRRGLAPVPAEWLRRLPESVQASHHRLALGLARPA